MAWHQDPFASRALSFLAAATVTWALNRAWTFAGRGRRRAHREWGLYVAATAFGAAVNVAAYSGCLLLLDACAAYPPLGVAAGSLVALAFNFAASRCLVFRAASTADPPS